MKVHLGSTQKDKLADLCLGIGQLFFGSLIIPYLLPTLDKPNPPVLLFGIVLVFFFWIAGIWIVRKR